MVIEESDCTRKDRCWDDTCNEEVQANEWCWEHSEYVMSSYVSTDCKDVTFHPAFSSGTAAIRGDTPLRLNREYYWEIKILSTLYGTDVMIGVGTPKVDFSRNLHRYASTLGEDSESWGFSYNGKVQHNGETEVYGRKYTKNSVVGVRLDMWRGTLEFYIDRVPQGIAFYNLRKHPILYPMICSTAAQSTMSLVYASSWPASLLSHAARSLVDVLLATPHVNKAFPKKRKLSKEKILPWFSVVLRQTLQQMCLADCQDSQIMCRIPPGLWNIFRRQFFLLMPHGKGVRRPSKVLHPVELNNGRILMNHCMALQRVMTEEFS